MKSKRKGFTLVELLIVIVVIGILSSMMMLSSTEAVTSAKATDIIANLRNLKTAALALYASSYDVIENGTTTTTEGSSSTTYPGDTELNAAIWAYMGSSNSEVDAKNYALHVYKSSGGATSDGTWYIIAQITGSSSEIEQIQRKLQGRAKTLGLIKATAINNAGDDPYDGSTKFVAMKVR